MRFPRWHRLPIYVFDQRPVLIVWRFTSSPFLFLAIARKPSPQWNQGCVGRDSCGSRVRQSRRRAVGTFAKKYSKVKRLCRTKVSTGSRCSVARIRITVRVLMPSGVPKNDWDTVVSPNKTLPDLLQWFAHIWVWNLSSAERRTQSLLQELHSSKSYTEPSRFEGI